jgi:hypothetical protein
MALLQRMTLLITFALFAPGLLADGLAGMWKNAEQPAWIEIEVSEGQGTGTVRRNDNKPEAVGRVLLKGVVAQEGSAGWVGQIYAEKLGEYKDATITLPEPDQMQIVVKVGFMSRTVNWARAAPVE